MQAIVDSCERPVGEYICYLIGVIMLIVKWLHITLQQTQIGEKKMKNERERERLQSYHREREKTTTITTYMIEYRKCRQIVSMNEHEIYY